MGGAMWGLMLLRGAVSVILGIMLLAWPDKSAEAFIMLFGLFAILTGLLGLIAAAWVRRYVWGVPLTGGILTVVIGLVAFLWPGLTAAMLVMLVAVWAIVFGLLEIIAGAAIPTGEPLRALVMGIGLFTVALGVLLLVDPSAGIAVASVLVGFYFIVGGVLTVYRALLLRRAPVTVIVR